MMIDSTNKTAWEGNMTVKELRQLLYDVKDQNAKVVIDGKSIKGFQTAYNQSLVRLSSVK
tara:strand:+ start:229 stop:408 length:180 start_codon:yes stop_codon:yes gene_type:complete